MGYLQIFFFVIFCIFQILSTGARKIYYFIIKNKIKDTLNRTFFSYLTQKKAYLLPAVERGRKGKKWGLLIYLLLCRFRLPARKRSIRITFSFEVSLKKDPFHHTDIPGHAHTHTSPHTFLLLSLLNWKPCTPVNT